MRNKHILCVLLFLITFSTFAQVTNELSDINGGLVNVMFDKISKKSKQHIITKLYFKGNQQEVWLLNSTRENQTCFYFQSRSFNVSDYKTMILKLSEFYDVRSDEYSYNSDGDGNAGYVEKSHKICINFNREDVIDLITSIFYLGLNKSSTDLINLDYLDVDKL